MPRRDSSRVRPIHLGGEPCVPLSPEHDGPGESADHVEMDWHGIADALDLPAEGGRYLEMKAAGMRGADLHEAAAIGADMAAQLGWTLRRRLRRGLLRDRQQFESVIRGGNSRCLSYEEHLGSGQYAWTLAELGPEFMQILNRERTKNITFSTCFSEPRTKRASLKGISRSHKMEYKRAPLNVTMLGEGEFFGKAAIYGNLDYGGDVLRPGALRKTLSESGGSVPLFSEHTTPIGIARLQDSPEGLLCHGVLNLEKQIARDVHSDLKFFHAHKKPFGLSIGYQTIHSRKEGNVRLLTEVRLHHISTTPTPMNPEARIDGVKMADADEYDLREVIRILDHYRKNFRLSGGFGARR